MKLSVIIVNYNVKYFLEQCLISVLQASKDIETEIFVVDNNSVDGSVEMVKERFPEIKLIANKDNVGFSKANNQAIRESKGEYVLLLNPDTLVEEDTFTKTVQFMDEHPDAGGLGVKMVDGKGRFLPESKRGLPTPQVAFYKMFGLSSLFPKSKKFGRYHLGFLDKDEIHKIDVLAGAFMLMRKKTLDEVGLLDETFFMYGEDIDLSWRIKLGGYENYYYPKTRIIHYKGESTKKGSLNYVFVFYKAMIIFAKKHFSSSLAGVYSFFINIAIYLRAALSLLRRFLTSITVPFIDGILIFLSLHIITQFYEDVKGFQYPDDLVLPTTIAFSIIMMVSNYFSGGYDKPVKLKNNAKGVATGAIIVLIAYSLLGESYRFSRAIILMGGLASLGIVLLVRSLYHLLQIPGYSLSQTTAKRIAVIGKPDEIERVTKMLHNINLNTAVIAEINPNSQSEPNDHFVGKLHQLPEIIEGFKLNEVIFCSRDIEPEAIINQMSRLSSYDLEYKIAPPESVFIIGSNSVNSTGELYSLVDLNSIDSPSSKRNKRLLDILISLIAVVLSPVLAIINNPFRRIFPQLFSVLFGSKTLVGYSNTIRQKIILPKIKKSVIYLDGQINNQNIILKHTDKAILNYSNNYHWQKDLRIIWNFLFGSKKSV
ncbi:glycosyltransferase family 2 protein [Salibacter halophilus]|uniref:Glycosyltransferase n=1 Tax=Salibacter halophilus TaxID=1803916 RepID=A0A6N6M7X3_9FLAO|nr:glycosyltransferase [Salibacter halophilus]KAB1064740.1 glycosyltransferase [Salibacter halophilus]